MTYLMSKCQLIGNYECNIFRSKNLVDLYLQNFILYIIIAKNIMESKNLIVILITIFISSCTVYRNPRLQAKVFEVKDGNTLNYNIYYPNEYGKSKEGLPLFIWLHGSGERGNDNVSQLVHVVPYLVSDEVQSKFPCIVLAPQCPKELTWSPLKKNEWAVLNSGVITKPMEKLILLIEVLLQDTQIDKNRVYIGGLSMGGFGTYDLLSRKPEWFSGAIPICGGSDLDKIQKYKNVPLWIFHGAEDDVVSVEISHEVLNALKVNGITPKYTEYPNGGHNIWDAAIREPELLPWLFAQRKLK